MKQTQTLPIAEADPLGIGFEDMLCWLRVKLADAERTLIAREQAESVWRSGDETKWEESAKYLRKQPIPKAERLELADKEKRIAVKCRREVEMFKATIAAISQHNA